MMLTMYAPVYALQYSYRLLFIAILSQYVQYFAAAARWGIKKTPVEPRSVEASHFQVLVYEAAHITAIVM